jgi:pimeloyl-ACP methyl ester carboxylesterase
LGNGRLGIVFANDSVNDTCGWMRDARALATRGYAVAVFETAGNYGYEAPQVREVAAALRRSGARRIALIGASVGARAVLQVAAQRPRGLAGVIALSAERKIIPAYPGDLLPIARKIRVPVLSVASRGDPLTAEGEDTRAWHRTISRDRLLLLAGSDHGVELLADRHRRRVRGAIRTFLRDL